MEEVVENRVRWGQIDLAGGYEGFVALLECEHLNRLVLVSMPDGEMFVGKVADCAAAQDREMLIGRNFAVDLSWPLAVKYGVVDNVVEGVSVYLSLIHI